MRPWLVLFAAFGSVFAAGCAPRAAKPLPGEPPCTELACLSSCAKGDCASCTEVLPRMHSASTSDAAASVQSIASACESGCSSLCAPAGIAYSGLSEPPIAGLSPDRPRALALFRKGCAAGSAPACNLTWYGAGKEVSQAAVDALTKACEGGGANACGNLGEMYVKGEGVQRDDAKGAALLQRACEAGDMKSCGGYGLVVLNGRGVPADPRRAAGILSRGCQGHDFPSCGYLGVLYVDGVGVPKDVARAQQLFRTACQGGDRVSCKNLTKVE